MKIKFCLFTLLLLINSIMLFSQVAINVDGSNPNNSAILDVKSNNKGLLPPRMVRMEMEEITNPANGLIVYCTDCSQDGKGVLSIFIDGSWNILTANCLVPLAPIAKIHIPSAMGIIWDWKGVSHATGYKWNTAINYTTATPLDTVTKMAETGLSCNTTYTRYVWAFNACGYSLPVTLTQTTLACSKPSLSTTVASAISPTTATCGGNVTNDGGSEVTLRGVCWGTASGPTTANSKIYNGTGIGIFTSNLTGLTENTTYYLRAFAINSVGTSYGNEIMFKTLANIDYLYVRDIDGNVYHPVTIGTQTWLIENLKTTKYRNGDPIVNVTDNTGWVSLATGAYCWYNNDAATYKATYGALYNWYAATDSRNIAPTGWHVATDAEWTTLTNYLGGSWVAGGKLKESGLTHWVTPNTDATNNSGFTAIPGGYRKCNDGLFDGLGYNSCWWSSSGDGLFVTFSRRLYYNNPYVGGANERTEFGFSVRCIKD